MPAPSHTTAWQVAATEHPPARSGILARVYFDSRLWGFTAGLRARIAWTVAVGVVGVAAGIARLAVLGCLLARVLQGAPPASLLPGLAAAAVTVARGWLEYAVFRADA
jgi:hypothetical protein